jgi:DNA-binding GntR family transcriptional regulator
MTTTPEVRERPGDAGARVAERVRTAIITGEWPPGARIRQEELSAQFGASRVPVRQALQLLEQEGLVTIVANSGAWVTRLSLAECEEVYRMRERLEPLLLGMSAPGLDDAALEELSELAARISAAESDTDAFLALDTRFHLLSYRAAHTAHLGDLVQRLWNITAPYRRAYVSTWTVEARRIAHEEHHLMVAALRDGDPEEAERVLAAHIRRTRRQLSRTPEIFSGAADGSGQASAARNSAR